ncbi:MAG: hypothetical protein AB1489_19740, partial [Acidobacteriota bacterium]
MKLLIKQKLIIFSALLILVPMLLSALLIILQVNSNIESQAALSIEKDARVAEQLYQNRQLAIVQVVQNAAQAISAQGLLESVQAPSNLQGSARLTARIQGDGRRRLDDVIKSLLQASNIDFIVVTDSQGTVMYPPAGEGVAAEGSLKDHPVLIALQNGVVAKKTDAQSSSMREPAERLRIFGIDALRKQAEVTSEGKTITDGLVLEAGAPIIGGGGNLLGVVIAGLLINNAEPDRSIANAIKNTLYPELRAESGASIALGDVIVSANLPIQQGGGVGIRIKGKLEDRPKVGEETINSEQYKTAYAPIKDINSQVIGRIGVQIKQSWFSAIVNRLKIIIGLIVVFFLLLASAVAVFAAQRLTRPII